MTNEYARLLAEVKERVRAAQYAAFRAVNKELVALYWDIGRMISERQIAGVHGDAVVEQLAADLRVEFPAVGGFSRRNVFYIREFYLTYRDLPKVQPLVAQIGWTHNALGLGWAAVGLNAYSKGVSLGLFQAPPWKVKEQKGASSKMDVDLIRKMASALP
jgi:hypothetical protein